MGRASHLSRGNFRLGPLIPWRNTTKGREIRVRSWGFSARAWEKLTVLLLSRGKSRRYY